MEEPASTSKKAAKKAEAKAKKVALKAQRALERRTASAAITTELDDDPAKDRYGQPSASEIVFTPESEEINLICLKDGDNGKLVILRAWFQNSRTQSADIEMEIKHPCTEVPKMLEQVLLYKFREIQSTYKDEIKIVKKVYPLAGETLLLEPGKEVRLTFAQAQRSLGEEGGDDWKDVKDDEDMSTLQEKALGALVREKFKTDSFVVDKFPETARPFYAKSSDKLAAERGAKTTNAFDFFLRGQEILPGGQSINNPMSSKKGSKPRVSTQKLRGYPGTSMFFGRWVSLLMVVDGLDWIKSLLVFWACRVYILLRITLEHLGGGCHSSPLTLT